MTSAKPPRVIASLSMPESSQPERIEKKSINRNPQNSIAHFLGAQLSNIDIEEEVERRTFEGFSVVIGRKDDSWHYAMTPIEHTLTRDEKLVLESLMEKLPDKLDIDVSMILKDQRLARELVRNAVSQLMPPMHIERAQCADLISRYSVGYGPLELLLADPFVEDVIVNAPASSNPVCVVTRLSKNGIGSIYCRTNLTISEDLLSSIVTKAKIFYGGELSATKPILEIELPYLGTRMSAVGEPVSRHGLSIALRRRAEFLWTLPRLVGMQTLSWTAAGFLSLCCAARASIVIAGGRGSGKTTFLSSLLPELPNNGRTVIMEDTEELPTMQLQREGMSVQTLSMAGGAERATAVMRAALRMGEGPIVVGEIRGEEAKVLFESIRTGTASSCVLGTMHASDARAVRDRIVLDMGLNEKSFEAIDLIAVVRQRKDLTSGSSTRYLSEFGLAMDNEVRPLFLAEESGEARTCMDNFNDLGQLGMKLSAHLGIGHKQILSASRIRGFIKLIQSTEWKQTGNEKAVSVRATRELNSINIGQSKEPDWNSMRREIIEKIHEVVV